jgi:hypothetical protein
MVPATPGAEITRSVDVPVTVSVGRTDGQIWC